MTKFVVTVALRDHFDSTTETCVANGADEVDQFLESYFQRYQLDELEARGYPWDTCYVNRPVNFSARQVGELGWEATCVCTRFE